MEVIIPMHLRKDKEWQREVMRLKAVARNAEIGEEVLCPYCKTPFTKPSKAQSFHSRACLAEFSSTRQCYWIHEDPLPRDPFPKPEGYVVVSFEQVRLFL